MGLESVLAFEDVIGDLASPWAIIYYDKISDNPERRSRRKWVHKPGRLFPCVHPGQKGVYGGKRRVFKEERNKGRVGPDRSGRGREFQMDGAANETHMLDI